MPNKDNNSMTSRLEMLGKAINSYVNYENLAEKAAMKGKTMKNTKDLYGLRILSYLSPLFKGKSEEEILKIVSRMNP